MFLGYQNGKIKAYTETLLDPSFYNFDEVVETEDEYVLDGDEYVLNDDNYKQKQFQKLKAEKLNENDFKANNALNHTFTVLIGEEKTPCEFIYNEKTERNLNSSAIGFLAGQYETKQWTDEQGITVDLTAEDVAAVLLTFNEFANAIWAKWGNYKQEIEQAETAEELDAIVINYGGEPEEETEPIENI